MQIRNTLMAAAAIVLFTAAAANAQMSGSNLLSASSTQLSATNYFYAKPNELTMIVNIVGSVQRPGRYEISTSIDLVNLMALAGGATAEGSLSDVKITRFLETEGRIRMHELHVNLENMSGVTAQELHLLPGDMVQVERSGWVSFKDVLNVVIGTAIITGAVAQVIYATKR